jgi:transcriptional regulator GlxA family with amidase domain
MAIDMTKTVILLAVPGVQLLDVSGPLDVFAEANVQAGHAAYRAIVVATETGPIRSASGVRLLPDHVVGEAGSRGADTLLVAGSPHMHEAAPDPTVLAWLREAAAEARRYGSVCSGAFLLAAAGLLEGLRITTHWAVAEQLALAYPGVIVDTDAIHLRDGRLRTAAGVTAGLDLALSLVEEDLGRAIAMKVAARLVMFFKRPGGQLQFSRRGESAPAGRSVLQEVQRWVAANPAADHSVPHLAARTGLSPRHFARLFRQEVGTTPAAWTEAARIAAARRRLEDGHEPPKQVAALCGFADADTLRRAFVRQVGVTPAEYRKRHGGTMTGSSSPPDFGNPHKTV